MKTLSLLTIPAIATVAIASLPAQAAQVIGGPTDRQFTIESLPDANYRFCSDRAEGIDRVSGVCFRFRKRGDEIVGDYYYPYEGSSLCVTGRVNNNTVSGQAVERLSGNRSASADLPEDAFTAWRQESFLKVRYAEQLSAPERIRYRSLLLNLNDFYQYNAGPVVPPQSCLNRADQPIGSSDSVPDYLRTIGESPFYNQPVYLDERSILQLEVNLYRYRTVIGVDTRESESDLIVDCDNPNQVRIVRARYYDENGQLSEVEEVDQIQPVSPEPPNTAKYNANQFICSNTEIGRTIPQEVTYERYSNDRFNYSVLYPDNVVTPQDSPTNRDGRDFRSPDGRITMQVYGVNNSLSQTLEERYQVALQADDNRNITYQALEDNFFVISGYEENDVIYQKTLLDNHNFKTLEIRYDRSFQPEFDPIVAEIANSFSSNTMPPSSADLPETVETAVLTDLSNRTGRAVTDFTITAVERQTWPDGCLGLASPGVACTQALVPGWQVRLKDGEQNWTYRTDETGDQIRLVNPA